MTELSPLEGTGQVATQELRALIERDAKGAISCDIVKRGEDLDDKLDELCGTVMSLADERCKGAGTGVGQTVSDLTDVCDAPFKKGDGTVTSEEVGDLAIGELGEEGRVVEGEAGIERATERGGQCPVTVVPCPGVVDAPTWFSPKAEIQGIEEENIVGSLVGRTAPVQGMIPVRKIGKGMGQQRSKPVKTLGMEAYPPGAGEDLVSSGTYSKWISGHRHGCASCRIANERT